ncbi:hypothetical protein cypCar_00008362 [Cyprinus carpio]|nr:hypothetical protein cypCar_00008362 [Cyprinus carpio]
MLDKTKTHLVKSNHLLRVNDHDFTMRPAFADAYTDEDLMLYWKSGDESLSTDDKISLSQFLIQKFHTTSRLAFYSSTGWYNRLYINFTLRRHIFFFLLQTYFPITLMVMLSWVSFWIDRRAVPARLSLGEFTGETNGLVWLNAEICPGFHNQLLLMYITSVSFKALPCTCDISHARTMILDEVYSKPDANSLAGYTQAPVSSEEAADKQDHMVVCLSLANEATGAKKKTLRGFRIIRNTNFIKAYSHLIFPVAFIFFNLIYWFIYC